MRKDNHSRVEENAVENVHPTASELALLEAIEGEREGHPAAVLVAGNRSGRPLVACRRTFPEAKVRAHAFDAFHARQIRNCLAEAGLADEACVQCAPAVEDGPYDLVLFMTTPQSMSAELTLDHLEDLRGALAPGGTLYAAFEGDGDAALATMKKVWKKVSTLVFKSAPPRRRKRAAPEALSVFKVRGGTEIAPRRNFAATWQASVPGGAALDFTTLPGCFCHRRPDMGGLALAEVATHDLAPAAHRVLDMGCGCGFVGLLVADALRRAGAEPELTLIDSHARAVAAARLNAERLGFAPRILLADDGLPRGETALCDVALCNPPYFGDWRIADLFAATAYRALASGGLAYFVAKNEAGLRETVEKYFPEPETISRRGYAVLKCRR